MLVNPLIYLRYNSTTLLCCGRSKPPLVSCSAPLSCLIAADSACVALHSSASLAARWGRMTVAHLNVLLFFVEP